MRSALPITLIACLVFALGALAQPPEPLPSPPADELTPVGPRIVPAGPMTVPEPNPPVGIEELVQLALQHNPTLAQARAEIAALRGRRVQVGLYPNPQVGYVANEMNADGGAGQQGFQISQQFVTANKLGLSQNVVGHEVVMAEQRFRRQQLRVVNDLRAAAYRALAAERRLEIARELVGIGERGVKTAQALLRAREVSRVDLLQLQVELNSARLQEENSTAQFTAAWRQLAALTGFNDVEPTPIAAPWDDALPEHDWDATVASLQAASPELAAARADLHRAQCNVVRQQAGRIPNVTVAGSVQYDAATDEPLFGLQVSAPIPVHNANQGSIAEARAQWRAAQQNLQRLELELRRRLAGTFGNYEAARKQVDRYQRELLPAARETLGLVQAAYEQGEIGYLDLLNAQRTYFRLRLGQVDAIESLRTTSVRMEGQLVSGGLSAPGND